MTGVYPRLLSAPCVAYVNAAGACERFLPPSSRCVSGSSWQHCAVGLVAARAEQRRRERLLDRAQQVDGEVDRRGQRKAQLTRVTLVRVCRLGTRDVLQVRFRDGRGMAGYVDLLQDYLFSTLLRAG